MSNIFFFFQTDRLEGYKYENGQMIEIDEKIIEEVRQRTYRWEGEQPITGCCRYITAMAKAAAMRCGGKLDIIIGACDDKPEPVSCKKIIEKDISKKEIIKPDSKTGEKQGIKWVDYSPSPNPEDEVRQLLNSPELQRLERGDTVYIATNSGVRDRIMFFAIFARILSYKGVNVEMLYSVRVNSDKCDEEIVTRNYVIDYLSVLTAVELFTSTGNPSKLIECCGNDISEPMKVLFRSMTDFYGSVQVCGAVFDDKSGHSVTDKYNQLISALKNFRKTNKDMIKGSNELIIRQLADEIKRHLRPLKKADGKPIDIDCFNFLQIIKWCLDNQMVLNACFIFDSEFPRFLKEYKERMGINIEFKDRTSLINTHLIQESNKYRKPGRDGDVVKICDLITASNYSYKCSNEPDDYFSEIGFTSIDGEDSHRIVMGYANLISMIRNQLAHANYSGSIRVDSCSCRFLVDKLQKRWQDQGNNEDLYDENPHTGIRVINSDNPRFFDIVKFIIEQACEDIAQIMMSVTSGEG